MSKLFVIQKQVIPSKKGYWCDVQFNFNDKYIKWHVIHTLGTRLNLFQAIFLYLRIKLSFLHKDIFLRNGSKGKFRIIIMPLRWWEKK